jgi:hypothetical protein
VFSDVICVARDKAWWLDFVNAVMNLRVSLKAEIYYYWLLSASLRRFCSMELVNLSPRDTQILLM